MGRERMDAEFGWKSRKEKDHQEDLDVGGNFQMDFREIELGGEDWIDLAKDRD
jgi:hypothetical protein